MNFEVFLKDLAELLEVEPEDLHKDFILDDDNWDSLEIVSAIALIDMHFDITIEGKVLRDCKNVGSLLDIIEMKKTDKSK